MQETIMPLQSIRYISVKLRIVERCEQRTYYKAWFVLHHPPCGLVKVPADPPIKMLQVCWGFKFLFFFSSQKVTDNSDLNQ